MNTIEWVCVSFIFIVFILFGISVLGARRKKCCPLCRKEGKLITIRRIPQPNQPSDRSVFHLVVRYQLTREYGCAICRQRWNIGGRIISECCDN
jgi:hypothetical protein